LEFLFKKYGVEEEMKEVTTDDKVWVVGILFNRSQMQEYIPNMSGKTRGSKVRADLDAVSSRKLAGFCTLFTRFIDKEVVVTLPEKWLWEETKTSIDALTCDGTFDIYGKFNPNNLVHIALNWVQKDVSGIFAKVVLEYQVCMKKYTMGTGDGPGAPENFSTWQTWDETYVSQYTQHLSHLYLTVVHIWDKQFGFPFVSKMDPMPDDCMIDDVIDFAGGEENQHNLTEEMQAAGYTTPLPTRNNLVRSISSTTSSTKSQSAQKEKGIENVLEKMSQGREEMKEATKEILDIMRQSASNRSSTSESEQHEIMDQMKKMMALIGICQKELKKLCRKKRAINNDTNHNQLSLKSTKRLKSISKSIKAQRKIIGMLEKAMEDQRKKLELITKLTGDTDDEESGSGQEEKGSKDDEDKTSEDVDNNEGNVDESSVDDNDLDP
jgi:hypothetical protein